MAHVQRRIDVDAPPDRAFAYLARFSNAAEWDPGTSRARMVTAEPVQVGSEFELLVRAFGRDSWWRYRIVEHDPASRRVALQAETSVVRADDTITVEARADGSTVVYDAELRLRGPLRVLDPLLTSAFRRIVDRGADGIQRALAAETARR
jgi:hypothetical protein